MIMMSSQPCGCYVQAERRQMDTALKEQVDALTSLLQPLSITTRSKANVMPMEPAASVKAAGSGGHSKQGFAKRTGRVERSQTSVDQENRLPA
jgi:hypothetical protein